jgi:hypothetical protein
MSKPSAADAKEEQEPVASFAIAGETIRLTSWEGALVVTCPTEWAHAHITVIFSTVGRRFLEQASQAEPVSGRRHGTDTVYAAIFPCLTFHPEERWEQERRVGQEKGTECYLTLTSDRVLPGLPSNTRILHGRCELSLGSVTHIDAMTLKIAGGSGDTLPNLV